MNRFRPVVAVLYQAIESPIIDGVRKPMKPGGYSDSSADIAYILAKSGVDVATPRSLPDPKSDLDWCWPDTEAGILAAIAGGANIVWANTVLFSSHPLQTSRSIPSSLRLVGQPPNLVEKYDDKAYTNELLRNVPDSRFTLPKAWTVAPSTVSRVLPTLVSYYPLVAKPIRGRGSHGVELCDNQIAVEEHLKALFSESPEILLEQYLSGEEATLTVMPPSTAHHRPAQLDRLPPGSGGYWCLPTVKRFNHIRGVAPYNGVVAVTANSRVLDATEEASDPAYAAISRQCTEAANLLGTTAPIRVDARQISDKPGAEFALFDINMKPNMTGAGRPGREDQASLTAMAAEGLGWDYPRFLEVMLDSAKSLGEMRAFN